MTTPSPSEFLTFYRRLTISSTLCYHQPVARQPIRKFNASFKSRANILGDNGTQQDSHSGQGFSGSRKYALDKSNKR